MFFNNKNPNLTHEQVLVNKYKGARVALASVLLLTIINIISAFANTGYYLLYSAFSSYQFGVYGAYLLDYGEEISAVMTLEQAQAEAYVSIGIAVALLIPFVLCWVFSKKHSGWLIAGLVFFILDTLYMFISVGINLDYALDYVIHIIVIAEIAMGIGAASKLKKMTENDNGFTYQPETYNTVETDGSINDFEQSVVEEEILDDEDKEDNSDEDNN